jgi:probable HAF family extracellular repeat protein
MKSTTFLSMTVVILVAAFTFPKGLAAQEPQELSKRARYLVFELGALGGTVSGASAINDRGWVMGAANLSGDTTEHATLWIYGKTHDLGTLGGPNSAVPWPAVKNNQGVIVGVSDTADDNPLGEVWSCALAFFPSASGKNCRGFVWKEGKMRALPTLGGFNGVATGVNNRGQIVGWAETTFHDPTCTLPQVLQFEGVIYGPGKDQIQALPPLPKDQDSAATAINDKGQVVGISGECSNAVGGLSAHHAVLWENGVPTDIGNFGGTAWNTPTAINNRGDVVGFSDFPGDSATKRNYHAFLWTKDGGMKDLGTLPGDTRSIAWGINNQGQIVGQSTGGPNGSHAVVWVDGVPTDLNTLIPGGPLTLTYANDIDSSGQIVGGAFNSKTGTSPGFVAIPAAGLDDGARSRDHKP